MTKSTTVRGPAQGVYYGNVANEALPPVHEVRVSHVPKVPQVTKGQKQVWNIMLLSLPPKLFSQYPLLKLYFGQLKLLPSLSKRLIQCLPRLSQ